MNATKLRVEWMEGETGQPVYISTEEPASLVRVGVMPVERRCPHCDSIVYSRRHGKCGACDEPLPANCLFTPEEAERVDMLLRTEREHHRKWLRRTAVA